VNKIALGRGLEALIPVGADQLTARTATVLHLEPERIFPNPYQPRLNFDAEKLKELADSIREHGIIHPILVKTVDEGYQIIVGERRWKAARIAGLARIPAMLLDNLSDDEQLQIALIENLQREDLNPIDEAMAYRKLSERFGLTQQVIAQRVGKDRSSVANTLRLLSLPEEVREKIAGGQLSAGHARSLLALDSAHDQIRLARRIINEGLSVRHTEELIYGRRQRVTRSGTRSAEIESLENRLRQHFGTAVRLTERRHKGKIIIEYYSHDDLNRVLELMGIH
jgi:ParB family chromosome partitioning protein